jgi:chromosome segregation ATPase
MAKTLTFLSMLLVVAGLAAQDATPTTPKPENKVEPPAADLHRRQIELARHLADVEEKMGAIQQAKNEQTAEYRVKLATLEAEHKTKLASLDRDIQRVSAAAEQINREMARLGAEANRQQTTEGRMPSSRPRGVPRAGPAGDVERPEGRPAGAATGPMPTADQKLDAIMQKLEQMEMRLRGLESKARS